MFYDTQSENVFIQNAHWNIENFLWETRFLMRQKRQGPGVKGMKTKKTEEARQFQISKIQGLNFQWLPEHWSNSGPRSQKVQAEAKDSKDKLRIWKRESSYVVSRVRDRGERIQNADGWWLQATKRLGVICTSWPSAGNSGWAWAALGT